jgi:hypothetical protein
VSGGATKRLGSVPKYEHSSLPSAERDTKTPLIVPVKARFKLMGRVCSWADHFNEVFW